MQQFSCPPLSPLNIGVSAKSWSTNWPKAARNDEMLEELIFLEEAILLVIILAFGRSWPSLSLLISPMSAKWFKIRVRSRFFDQVGHETMYACSICSLNLVIVRLTKIVNRANKNWAQF